MPIHSATLNAVLQANPPSHTLEEWLYVKSKWSQQLLNESQEQSVMELVLPNTHSTQTEQIK